MTLNIYPDEIYIPAIHPFTVCTMPKFKQKTYRIKYANS
ncbi:hypothetical protein M23134_02159 [Microscilla marina ATCC 23134]|uniref:Uncharacterized protein n=1 Tax=Microscilla marina ATCC 23134 TaxID=313606 RepID=A1ZND8_MICM2|nr:hypothetical protein M23134_02159 [Microscilla marina ATCC 23134]